MYYSLYNTARRFLRLAAIPLLALPGFPAHADEYCCRPTPHWYLSISASTVFLTDADLSFQPRGILPDVTSSYDTGYGLTGAIGYRLWPNIRGELEVTYRENQLALIDGEKVGTSTNGGYLAASTMNYMVNGYYDFHNASPFTPYLGLGVGGRELLGQHVWSLAYQGMAGITYQVQNQPVEMFFGYRYASGLDFKNSISAPPLTGINVSNTSHNLELGLRIFMK